MVWIRKCWYLSTWFWWVVLLGEGVEPLGTGALLEGVHHWGWALSILSLTALLIIPSLCFLCVVEDLCSNRLLPQLSAIMNHLSGSRSPNKSLLPGATSGPGVCSQQQERVRTKPTLRNPEGKFTTIFTSKSRRSQGCAGGEGGAHSSLSHCQKAVLLTKSCFRYPLTFSTSEQHPQSFESLQPRK